MAFCVFRIGIYLKEFEFFRASKVGFGLVLTLGVGFSLAAIQLFPTLEFTELSTRAGGVSYAFATDDSLHPKELLSFLVPDIFGNIYSLLCDLPVREKLGKNADQTRGLGF